MAFTTSYDGAYTRLMKCHFISALKVELPPTEFYNGGAHKDEQRTKAELKAEDTSDRK